MTATEFRQLALGFPAASEGSHMGHPDFRVGGKIFASLGPDASWGALKLTPDQQALFIGGDPNAFEPASGAWGRQGYTVVRLRHAKKTTVRNALTVAWHNTAPKKLVQAYGQK